MSPPAAPSRQQGAFSLPVVLVLLAVGITAFCAFVVLGTFRPEAPLDGNSGATPTSTSAVGFAALVRLLQAEGVPVEITRGRGAPARREFRVVTPPPGRKPDLPRVAAGSVLLIVLPKWEVLPDGDHPGWVDRVGAGDLVEIAKVLPTSSTLHRREDTVVPVLKGVDGVLTGLEAGPVDHLQTASIGYAWSPAIVDGSGNAVVIRSNRAAPIVYVLTDPDLLNTQGLKNLDTARAALAILAGLRGDLPVTFEGVPATPAPKRDLLQALLTPPLLGATLCAAACGLLIGAMALHRFGPIAPSGPVLGFGKRALADNAATLIALARREPRMGRAYADLTRTLALEETGTPMLPPPQADAALDEAGRLRGLPDTFTGLAAAATAARDRTALVAAAQGLHRWRQGIRLGQRQ